MVNWKSRKLGDVLWFANGLAIVVIINMLASSFFVRLDLTEEKRYSIKPQTREMLENLDEDVYVEVFLEGDLNAGFRRFRKNIAETLEEFRIYSDNKVKYTFTDPAAAAGEKARNEFMMDLAERGIQPTNVVDRKDGERVEKIIFPGALVTYGGRETGVMLLKGNKAATSEEVINQSIEGVEFEIANTILKLANQDRKRVGFVRGHGEVDSLSVASLRADANEFYDVVDVSLSRSRIADLTRFDALVISKPRSPYSPLEKFRLDQYIMRGGSVLFFVDKLDATMDSATYENALSFPYNTNLDDQLFRYGARINLDLIQDRNSGMYPIVTGQVGGKPQMQMLEWPFFPLINNYPDHAITRNLDAVMMRFVSSIDTVKAPGVKKTPLLYTSPYTRKLGAPVNISVNGIRRITNQDLMGGPVPVAYLLEGKFSSLFKNRFLPEGADSVGYLGEGNDAKILVVADGDVVRNEVNPRTLQPQPLGFDPYANYTFANREFVLNALAYMTDENGLIQARTKQVKIRPLDKEKARTEKTKWQLINVGLPILFVIVFGIVRSVMRKRKYARF